MRWMDTLERKIGRYAIQNLMKYIVILEVVGVVVSAIGQFSGQAGTSLYSSFFALDMGAILRGEVWRLFTFLIGEGVNLLNMLDLVFFIIRMYLYLYIGGALENAWGAFRFNLYYFAGVLFNILAASILYAGMGRSYPFNLEYLNLMLFLAFAVLYPNLQLLLFFFIPVKVKWLGIAYAFFWLYSILQYLLLGDYFHASAIFVAMANFTLFFLATRNYKRLSVKERKRRSKFRGQVRRARSANRHKCAICGRTEEDDERLEFRYCSKCEGNYEYCSDHLFSHEHVHKR